MAFHRRIKENPEKHGTFYDVSCNGNSAKALSENASKERTVYDDNGVATTVRTGWLHDMWGDGPEGSWVYGQGEIWRQWAKVVEDGRSAQPSAEAVRTFGHKCRRLFR